MRPTFWATWMTLGVISLGLSCAEKSASEVERFFPESFDISIENTASLARVDQAVALDITGIQTKYPGFNSDAFAVVAGDHELPSQAVDLNGDRQPDQIIFVADFTAQEEKTVTVRYASSGKIKREYPKRTQAELSHKVGGQFVDRKYEGGTFQNVSALRVPAEHTDHSLFIRYEGPGWESDKVGYRFYLDWRNATDIFGKKVPKMVLQNVGLDGFDSYHEMSDWGMDILKVGESLGIGSLGMWDGEKAVRVAQTDSITCTIAANGPVYSQIRTQYDGWEIGGKQYDLTSNLSITAGSRLTRHGIEISGNPENLCTGIVKHPDAKLLTKTGLENGWSYLATYGKQSLAEDNLGMAVLYRTPDLMEVQEDSQSHVVVLNPTGGKLTYYFLAAWEKEPGGIQNEAQFVQYLENVVAELNSPLKIRL